MKAEGHGGMRGCIVATAIAPFLLAGCTTTATSEPRLTPVEVVVPVASGCVPANLADAPDYPDTDADLRAAPDAATRYQMLYGGRKLRDARLREIEPIVAACPKAAVR